MANIKAQLFFESNAGSIPLGATEGHWIASATINTLSQALAALRELATARTRLLGAGAAITYMRVSSDAIRGDSQVDVGIPLPFGANGGAQPSGAPIIPIDGQAYLPELSNNTGNADFGYSRLNVRCESSADNIDTYRAVLPLAFLPDSWQSINLAVPTNPLFNQGMDAFKLVLLSGKWGFRVKDKGPTNPARQITNIQGGNPVVVTVAQHGFASGDRVQIQGVLSVPKVQGTYQITRIDPDTFSLNSLRITSLDYQQGGTARKIVFKVVPYTKIFPVRWMSRRVGRPFFLYRGSAKV